MPVPAAGTALVEYLSNSATVGFYLSPVFWAFVGAVFLAERVLPARPTQPVLSQGLRVDVTYVVVTHASGALIHLSWVALLRQVYDQWLGFLTWHASAAWPAALTVTLGILLRDFVAWFHHWVRHRVPFFWRFHAVHHAQRELNLFTDVRYHPLEYFVTTTINALPMFALGNSLAVVAGWSFAATCYTRLTHANVRLRLGPLRYLLVTPQSHRIHHSPDPAHRDTNYGVVFSLWDRLLGTQHPCDDEYPETGIDDPSFPIETSPIRALVGHFLYPFRRHGAPAAPQT